MSSSQAAGSPMQKLVHFSQEKAKAVLSAEFRLRKYHPGKNEQFC